ncbi:MAG: hypothetical protein ACRC8A_10425 [Microcoleaceae cyanobacterium]
MSKKPIQPDSLRSRTWQRDGAIVAKPLAVASGLLLLGSTAFYLLNSSPTLDLQDNRPGSSQSPQPEQDSLFRRLPEFPSSTPRPQNRESTPESRATNPGEEGPRGEIENARPEIIRSLSEVRPGSNTAILIPSPEQFECYTQHKGGMACFDDSYRPSRPQRRFFRQSTPITDEQVRRNRAEATICSLRALNGTPVSCGLPRN